MEAQQMFMEWMNDWVHAFRGQLMVKPSSLRYCRRKLLCTEKNIQNLEAKYKDDCEDLQGQVGTVYKAHGQDG